MKSKLLSIFFKYSKGGIRSRTFAIIAGIPYSTTTATKADPNQLSRGVMTLNDPRPRIQYRKLAHGK